MSGQPLLLRNGKGSRTCIISSESRLHDFLRPRTPLVRVVITHPAAYAGMQLWTATLLAGCRCPLGRAQAAILPCCRQSGVNSY